MDNNKKRENFLILNKEFHFLTAIINKPALYKSCYGKVERNNFCSLEAKELWDIISSIVKDKEAVLSIAEIEQRIENRKDNLKSDLINRWQNIRTKTPLEDITSFIEEIVKENSKNKAGEHAGKAQLLFDMRESSQAVDHLNKAIECAQSLVDTDAFMMGAEDCLNEYIKHHDLSNPGEDGIIGIRSGLRYLDSITKGLKPGELTVIGARPSVGKSALMATMVHNISSTQTVAFFSMEMNLSEVMKRMISMCSKIRLDDINNKRYLKNEKMKARYDEAIESYRKRKFFGSSVSSLNIKQIQLALKKVVINNPDLKVVFVDYLQYIQDHTNKFNSTYQVVSDISKGLKTIARELQISVVALSQLSRAASEKGTKPNIYHLKESGSIEQDADVVILLSRSEKNNAEKADPNLRYVDIINMEVAKNRNGRTGTVRCQYFKEYTYFRDSYIEEDYAQQPYNELPNNQEVKQIIDQVIPVQIEKPDSDEQIIEIQL